MTPIYVNTTLIEDVASYVCLEQQYSTNDKQIDMTEQIKLFCSVNIVSSKKRPGWLLID